jgi:hypothetical protein
VMSAVRDQSISDMQHSQQLICSSPREDPQILDLNVCMCI